MASNEPDTIREAVSSGCMPMTNHDMAEFYWRTQIGMRVVVTC
jgi:lipoprotein-anchoring transpeptidase ErfK/SrfK